MDTLSEINLYFRTRKGKFGSFKDFKNIGLYEFYGNIFGPLIYTEDKTHNFIGVDKTGTFYDEVYYPFEEMNRSGTVIPKRPSSLIFLNKGKLNCSLRSYSWA